MPVAHKVDEPILAPPLPPTHRSPSLSVPSEDKASGASSFPSFLLRRFEKDAVPLLFSLRSLATDGCFSNLLADTGDIWRAICTCLTEAFQFPWRSLIDARRGGRGGGSGGGSSRRRKCVASRGEAFDAYNDSIALHLR